MTKRIIALFLCLLLCVSVFVGCSGRIDPQSEYKGQQVIMYLTENIYNLDPAYAYNNDATRSVVGMLFETLFTLDGNGKVQNSLAKSYRTEKKKVDNDVTEYYMYIEIREDAFWSDNVPVTADDVVYAWKRLLNPNNSFEAASLLFDIKNARAYNNADVSKDDIGLFADDKLLTIQFESQIDYDHFLMNLTSLALAPLREDIASKNADWSKKPSVSAYSGPFKLSRVSFATNGENVYNDLYYSIKMVDKDNKVMKDKNGNDMYTNATEVSSFKEQIMSSFVLERNMYYFRNSEKDEMLDKSVTPYRIIVDCSLSADAVKKAYNDGAILFVGDIPMSIRSSFKDEAIVKDSLSTTSAFFNQNADVAKTLADGSVTYEKLFANTAVRQALSLAINRGEIAKKLVFANKATGLVPTGVADTADIKNTFRDNAKNNYQYLATDTAKAQQLLANAGITPSAYTFTLSVAAYDEDLVYVAEQVCAAWCALGFNVTVEKIGTIANNDYHKDVNSIPSDLCDDLYDEAFRRGDFDTAIADVVAYSADPFSVLAPFATGFSGQALDMSDSNNYQPSPHITGYSSAEFDAVAEKIYAQKTISSRSSDLHRAEEILMNDMPVAPIVFNQSAYLINSDMLNLNNKFLFWETSSNYYPNMFLQKMSLSDKKYEEYELTCAKYIYNNFDNWKASPLTYFGTSFSNFTKQAFVYTSSNYFYLFKDKCVIERVEKKGEETDLIKYIKVDGVDKKGNKVTYTYKITYAEGYEWMPIDPDIYESGN